MRYLKYLVLIICLSLASFAIIYNYPSPPALGLNKKIVVVVPASSKDEYVAGVNLALQEINRGGGLLGSSLLVEYIDELPILLSTSGAAFNELMPKVNKIADKISRDPSVIAVIGDGRSPTAIPAAVILNSNRKLLVTTGATSPALTSIGFTYVFSLQPSDDDVSAVLAHYAFQQNWKRVVLISDSSLSSVDYMIRLRDRIAETSSEILYEQNIITEDPNQLDRIFLFLLDNLQFPSSSIDAFFVSSKWSENYSMFINRARKLGLNQPIIGPANIYSRELEKLIGKESMRGIIGFSLYDVGSPIPEKVQFVENFKNAYGRVPYGEGAMGYTALKLLAYAISKTNSFDSSKLAIFLRSMRYEEKLKSPVGSIAFNNSGLITDDDLHVVYHDGESFKTVATYDKPFNWLDNNDEAHSILRSLITGDARYKFKQDNLIK
jgi:branched-chain amino acid transport system substrate-binding protein